jgi:glycosyltransferase involved in cell wall biosynthesis
MPKISVIMSAYNAEKYIRQAIGSILSQTMGDFEFFIVNDASTDSTAEIISSFNDRRIIRIENKINKGIAASANACMDAAKGEYIARMDADDISMPQRFKRQADFLDNNPETSMCGSWIKTFGPIKIIFTDIHALTKKSNS